MSALTVQGLAHPLTVAAVTFVIVYALERWSLPHERRWLRAASALGAGGFAATLAWSTPHVWGTIWKHLRSPWVAVAAGGAAFSIVVSWAVIDVIRARVKGRQRARA